MLTWLTIIVLNVISIGFAIITILRIHYGCVKRHHLPESKYTLLFRFISIKKVATVYLFAIIFVAAVSFALTYLTYV